MSAVLAGFSPSELEQLDKSLTRLRPVAAELEQAVPERIS
jgi:hypothetical protein